MIEVSWFMEMFVNETVGAALVGVFIYVAGACLRDYFENRRLIREREMRQFEACRTILGELIVERKYIYAHINETPWDKIKDRIDKDPDYQPLFIGDNSRSQLEKICDKKLDHLPTYIIEPAIQYLSLQKSVSLLGDKIMAPRFIAYPRWRKVRLLDRLKQASEKQLREAPRLAESLDRACVKLAESLKEGYEPQFRPHQVQSDDHDS